jgi:hypothetical protein
MPSHGSAIAFLVVALILIRKRRATQGGPCPHLRRALVQPHPFPFRPITAVSLVARGDRVARPPRRTGFQLPLPMCVRCQLGGPGLGPTESAPTGRKHLHASGFGRTLAAAIHECCFLAGYGARNARIKSPG